MNWNDGSEDYNKIHALRLDLLAIYEALKVSNVDDALAAIRGLQARVKFTADYETLKNGRR